MFHILNIVNLVFYIIVIVLMIGSLATGADQITQFQEKTDSDRDDYVISTVLLLSSFYSVIIIFSILCIVVLWLSGNVGIYQNSSYRSTHLTFNSIILTMSLLVMFPTVSAVYETDLDAFTGMLLIGSVLSILLSLINVSVILHHIRTDDKNILALKSDDKKNDGSLKWR